MVRNRRVTVEHGTFTDDDFGDNDNQQAAAAAVAVQQPPPINPSAGQLDGKAILAKLFNIDVKDVESLVKLKEESALFSTAAQAQEFAETMRSRMDMEHKRQWAGRSCRDRTQDVVNATWGGEAGCRPYRVAIIKNPDARGIPESITLDIPARSPEEARGRYQSVCGIISTDHHIKAVPLDDVKARAARRHEEEVAFAGAGENEHGEIVDARKFMES